MMPIARRMASHNKVSYTPCHTSCAGKLPQACPTSAARRAVERMYAARRCGSLGVVRMYGMA